MKLHIKWRRGAQSAETRKRVEMTLLLLAMLFVALISAAITVRLAIHGSVVEVPNLSGMTMEEAARQTSSAGLNLSLENKFYSTTVPSGRVLSQSPAPGGKVRRDWHVRVTESMGAQKVPIPDTTGMNQRDAAMAVRRDSLDLGTLAHMPAPGPSEMVLAQTPPPNAEGVDKPQVSLLLSSSETLSPKAWVMPSFVGLTLRDTQRRATEMGVRLIAIAPYVAPAISAVTAPQPVAQTGAAAVAVPIAPVAPVVSSLSAMVTGQIPSAGFRVATGETVKVLLNGAHVSAPSVTPTPAPSQP
jgi:beta-lactam-binding protein with PASTA domain